MTDRETRQDLLVRLGMAIDALGVALSALGTAYELLDTQSADRLEEQLFAPVQKAYGRAKRTATGFAERHQLQADPHEPPDSTSGSRDVRRFLDIALSNVDEAEQALIELQDSMLPVEYGDPELRAGLADTRDIVANVRASARQFTRTLGR
jgi:hypothetical protein